jgi:hypothetical protein
VLLVSGLVSLTGPGDPSPATVSARPCLTLAWDTQNAPWEKKQHPNSRCAWKKRGTTLECPPTPGTSSLSRDTVTEPIPKGQIPKGGDKAISPSQ